MTSDPDRDGYGRFPACKVPEPATCSDCGKELEGDEQIRMGICPECFRKAAEND